MKKFKIQIFFHFSHRTLKMYNPKQFKVFECQSDVSRYPEYRVVEYHRGTETDSNKMNE